MISRCPGCKEEISNSTKILKLQNLLKCGNCGIPFKILSDAEFLGLKKNYYSSQSWGNVNKNVLSYEKILKKSKNLRIHMLRHAHIAKILSENLMQRNKNFPQKILSVGPGIGLFEYEWDKYQQDKQVFFMLLEPSTEVYNTLSVLQFNKICVNDSVEILNNLDIKFDLILCLGVDYLFKDLRLSLDILNEKLEKNGLLVISRNVFINMQRFFNGKTIETFDDLVTPNKLINAYFFEEHYREILKDNFNILDVDEYLETYELDSSATHFTYFLEKREKIGLSRPEKFLKWKNQYTQKIYEMTKQQSYKLDE